MNHKELNKLIEGCIQQDRCTQKALYSIFAKKMFNTAFRIIKNEDDAADILQDAFVEVFQGINSFRSPENVLEHWIRRIVINKALNVWRKRKQLQEDFMDPTEDWDILAEPEESHAVWETEPTQEKLRLIRDIIQTMHDGYRMVLNLYLWEGYDHQEIAEILGIQESTSRTQFMRGRRKLVEILTQKGIQYGT